MADVLVTGQSDANADDIWQILRGFLWDWHPAIETMQEQRSPNGALIRAFTVTGEDTLYREQLTYFSDSDRSLAYTHLEGIAGAERYTAQINVKAKGSGCQITMTAQIVAPDVRAKEIAKGTKAVFESTIAVLAEGGVFGRMFAKVNATAAVEVKMPEAAETPLETVILDGDARGTLAFLVTPMKDGPVCVFLHGIGGGRGNWTGQLGTAALHMRAAAMDLRGYGDSTLGAEASTVDAYCDDILRVMTALGVERVVLCGLSYGAWIATSFAVRYPDKLLGMILSGGCTGMSEAPVQIRDGFRKARLSPLEAGQTPADFAPSVVDMLCAPGASLQARQELLTSMSAIPPETYRDAVTCFTNPSNAFDFKLLSMPVMMVTGEHDALAPPSEIRTVAQRIHDSVILGDMRFERLHGAGHVCNVEDPAAYNALLSDFLKRLPT